MACWRYSKVKKTYPFEDSGEPLVEKLCAGEKPDALPPVGRSKGRVGDVWVYFTALKGPPVGSKYFNRQDLYTINSMSMQCGIQMWVMIETVSEMLQKWPDDFTDKSLEVVPDLSAQMNIPGFECEQKACIDSCGTRLGTLGGLGQDASQYPAYMGWCLRREYQGDIVSLTDDKDTYSKDHVLSIYIRIPINLGVHQHCHEVWTLPICCFLESRQVGSGSRSSYWVSWNLDVMVTPKNETSFLIHLCNCGGSAPGWNIRALSRWFGMLLAAQGYFMWRARTCAVVSSCIYDPLDETLSAKYLLTRNWFPITDEKAWQRQLIWSSRQKWSQDNRPKIHSNCGTRTQTQGLEPKTYHPRKGETSSVLFFLLWEILIGFWSTRHVEIDHHIPTKTRVCKELNYENRRVWIDGAEGVASPSQENMLEDFWWPTTTLHEWCKMMEMYPTWSYVILSHKHWSYRREVCKAMKNEPRGRRGVTETATWAAEF